MLFIGFIVNKFMHTRSDRGSAIRNQTHQEGDQTLSKLAPRQTNLDSRRQQPVRSTVIAQWLKIENCTTDGFDQSKQASKPCSNMPYTQFVIK